MKFSFSWLKHYLDTQASLFDICTKLTALGLEVDGVDDQGKKLEPFLIAQIIEAVPHPNADRLRVCTVDTGHEKLQVVCGAPNARSGIKVVLARPGDVMPDSGEVLKKGTIRGIESQGMICAVDELGIGDEHDGILELAADAPVGESFAAFAGYNDAVIDVNLTPNRPDCAGVLGIARDLAAAGMGKFKPPDTKAVLGQGVCKIKVSLDLPLNNKACPLFIGRTVSNIKNSPSPLWLQRRLASIGVRSISALVDITNYLTFDCARPLHVFDANKLKGNLKVSAAKGGETFLGLNGKTYTLDAGMTIISDESGVISLGGIMGGATTACDETTTDVFIEAAYFDRVQTALTGRALQLTSDARFRFERGVDPLFTEPGAEIATRLILEICGSDTSKASNLEIVGAPPPSAREIMLGAQKCLKHTGADISCDEQEAILTSLGFSVKRQGPSLCVYPPSWRPDVEGDVDLVEEIIRVKGYDYLPVTSLERLTPITHPALTPSETRLSAARRALAAQGLLETVTWSFMSGVIAREFGPLNASLSLTNPISIDLNVMRPSILGNLIQAAKRNADRGFSDVGLFEIGPIFKDQTPTGQITVATTLRTGHTPRHWAEPSRVIDAFDAKADALAALGAAGAPTSLQVTTDAPAWYHPGRSGVLRLGPKILATFGEIHPTVLQACDINGPVVGCEVFFAHIPEPRSTSTAKPLLKLEQLQALSRDFAFVVDKETTAFKVIKAIKDADKLVVRDVSVFDVYEGDKIEPTKKSIALSVTLQPAEKSFTDAEIDAICAKIVASVIKATGAVLRT